MIVNTDNVIPFLQFPLLAKYKDIFHGIFTRKYGNSKKPFDSLNISFNCSDNPESVQQNRAAVSQCFDKCELVFINQIHGNNVLIFENENKDKKIKKNADAIVSNIAQKGLVIQTADCQAVMLYDPVKKIVANIHSGWRGTVANIVGITINIIKERFKSTPENIIAAIGPCLGQCCAEFVNYKKEFPGYLWKYKDEKNHFDLLSITKDQLINSGIQKNNIDSADICTSCNTKDFFSFRKEKITGRFASVIGICEEIYREK